MRFGAQNTRLAELEHELGALRELFGCIHKLPQHEALDVFTRIRSTGDPMAVLCSIKDAELLLLTPTSSDTSTH